LLEGRIPRATSIVPMVCGIWTGSHVGDGKWWGAVGWPINT
jgi:hypothetical protein